MANILYRGSVVPSGYATATAGGAGANRALSNLEIDQNFFALDNLKFDKAGGTIFGATTINGNLGANGSVTIAGDLTVNGTTTTINSTTISVDDINIELGSVATPTNTTANGGGITLKGASDKTFNWYSATAAWTSSEHLALAAGKSLYFLGSSSGTATIVAPAAAGTPTLTLPTTSGTFAITGDIGNGTMTVSAGSGLTGGGQVGTANQSGASSVTLSHGATSSVTALSASARRYVTGLTFDTFGHVTGYTTSTETVVDTNTTYSSSAIAISGGGAYLRLASSTGVNSDVAVKGGNNVTVVYDSATAGIKISSVDTTVLAIKNSSNVVQFYGQDGDANGIRFAGTGLGVAFDGMTNSITYSTNYGTVAGTSCQGNDARLSDSRNAADVYTWAKQSSKPSYSKSEITGLTNSDVVQFTGLTLNAPGANATLNFFGSVGTNYSYIQNNSTATYQSPLIFANTSTGILGGFDNAGNFSTTGNITVASGLYASYIYMSDADNGRRIIHCNSDRVGFLKQDESWGSYCEDDGSWVSAGNVTAYSDIKLKTNIQKIDNALAKVCQLNGYTFDRTDIEVPRQTGVIAQEVHKVLPEAVSMTGDTMTVAYGNMVGILIEAIKELNAKVEDLQNQLANK